MEILLIQFHENLPVPAMECPCYLVQDGFDCPMLAAVLTGF